MHCAAAAQTELTLEETDDLLDELTADEEGCNDDEDERDEGATEDGAAEDGATDDGTLDERTLDAADEVTPQIVPVTTGISTAPLVLTCIPNDTVCPGGIPPFQLKLDAL